VYRNQRQNSQCYCQIFYWSSTIATQLLQSHTVILCILRHLQSQCLQIRNNYLESQETSFFQVTFDQGTNIADASQQAIPSCALGKNISKYTLAISDLAWTVQSLTTSQHHGDHLAWQFSILWSCLARRSALMAKLRQYTYRRRIISNTGWQTKSCTAPADTLCTSPWIWKLLLYTYTVQLDNSNSHSPSMLWHLFPHTQQPRRYINQKITPIP